MAELFTQGSDTYTPDAVEVFMTERESRNIVHNVIGRANPDITLRPAGLRTGTLSVVFRDELDALAFDDAHAVGAVFTYDSGSRPTLSMTYVPVGRLTRELDPSSLAFWRVTFDFQEVSP